MSERTGTEQTGALSQEPIYADPYTRITWLHERIDELEKALAERDQEPGTSLPGSQNRGTSGSWSVYVCVGGHRWATQHKSVICPSCESGVFELTPPSYRATEDEVA